jgi:hypothetical protein
MKIKLKKERVILSDVLPYETPLTFSNRYFYDFIVKNNVFSDGKLVKWKAGNEIVDALIFMMFGLDRDQIESVTSLGGVNCYEDDKVFITIPFSYGISHKESSFRKLSIMHPRNQIQVVDFYEKYKEVMMYFCQTSKYSLRSPAKVASSKFFDERERSSSVVLTKKMNQGSVSKYKNLKSFFSYRKISNIHQFFESSDYHFCEQKYNNMAQLDISKCFDSIYTHSIAWAVFGREVVKSSMANKGQGSTSGSFPDDFDKLMQRQNYNETNGILIGPELSRIFSEIILQKIDSTVYKKLKSIGIEMGRDYEAFRYVDDFFVFFNDDAIYKRFSSELETSLNEFKLGLNADKELIYHKPIITELTIAKRKISELLSVKIIMDIKELDELDDSGKKVKIGIVNIRSKPLITQFKIILSESGVDYKGVMNYTLSIVEKNLLEIFKRYEEVKNDRGSYRKLIDSIHAVIVFCFFIYSVDPKVNTTIKLSRVLKVVINFSRSKSVTVDDMHQIFKVISDNVSFIISKYETSDYTQVETLYLLTAMVELGKDYWIDEGTLVSYFGGEYKSPKTVLFQDTMNYFSITVLLFYIKNKKRYEKIKSALKLLILNKLKSNKGALHQNTECLLLSLDCFSCPYLNDSFKKQIMRHYGVRKPGVQSGLLGYQENWFTKWENFEFGKELDAKKSEEVY